jgi:hypothetical protein
MVLLVWLRHRCAFGVAAGTCTLGTGATTLGDGARVGLALGAVAGTGEGMTL